jgi:hypothetical protein
VVNNTIVGHSEGVRASNFFDPTLRQNRVMDNKTGLVVGPGMRALLENNLFVRNGVDSKGQEVPVTTDTATVAAALPEPLDLKACRQMFQEAEADQVTRHPLLVYDLGEPLGAFDVTAFFNGPLSPSPLRNRKPLESASMRLSIWWKKKP